MPLLEYKRMVLFLRNRPKLIIDLLTNHLGENKKCQLYTGFMPLEKS